MLCFYNCHFTIYNILFKQIKQYTSSSGVLSGQLTDPSTYSRPIQAMTRCSIVLKGCAVTGKLPVLCLSLRILDAFFEVLLFRSLQTYEKSKYYIILINKISTVHKYFFIYFNFQHSFKYLPFAIVQQTFDCHYQTMHLVLLSILLIVSYDAIFRLQLKIFQL